MDPEPPSNSVSQEQKQTNKQTIIGLKYALKGLKFQLFWNHYIGWKRLWG